MLNRPVHFVLLALLFILLGNCGGTARVKPNGAAPLASQPTSKSQSNSNSNDSNINPKNLIAQAQLQPSPYRETLLLQAAQHYLEQGKWDKVRKLTNSMNPAQLPDAAYVAHSQITAFVDLTLGDIESACRILSSPRLERQLNALEPQQEAELRELRAQAYLGNNQLDESVSERINLSALLTDKVMTTANQETLWQTLLSTPLETLQTKATQGAGGITQGWYSLAALSKNNTQDIETQQAQLRQWLNHWQSHPANGNLPKDLQLLLTLTGKQPKKIALLLPLQGKLAEAGEAVRDGFFAAYYQTLHNKQLDLSISQYDTSQSATAAYQLAVAEGADFIIGPLDKDDVKQISQLPQRPVPVLTLNYWSPSDTPAKPQTAQQTTPTAAPALQTLPPTNLYQFGLAVEDEARQAARQAIQRGLQRALIVVPTQEWSERSAQAFSEEWQKLGGVIVGKALFTDQDRFAETIRHIMLIDESQTRMNLLQQQLGSSAKFEFTPRRRTDVDMIFMAAAPSQGRQIKPTFAFYYANKIATYATSNIYSGDVDATNNDDLNGVLFTTLPWLFDSNNPEKQALAQNTKTSAVYSRLQALGADAFHLYARLPQLQQAPQMRLFGATGSLHLLADGRIEREQIWATFNNGLAEPVLQVTNTATGSENNAPSE
jgi:uncharacterized protein